MGKIKGNKDDYVEINEDYGFVCTISGHIQKKAKYMLKRLVIGYPAENINSLSNKTKELAGLVCSEESFLCKNCYKKLTY